MSSSHQGKADRKKSILKQRDPETEQLLSDSFNDSPVKRPKAPPVKFIGVSKDEDDKSPRKKLPCSPIPSRKVPRAPLADLLADFEGPQENTPTNEEKKINDALLDQQNANTALRCSRQNCKLNAPAQNSSIIQDPLIAPFYIPLCICGAPMTRIPVHPIPNDNEKQKTDLLGNFNSSAQNKNNLTEQTVALNPTKDMEHEDKNSGWATALEPSRDKKVTANGGNRHQTPIDIPRSNLNDEDNLLSSGSTPTEETKLIDEIPLPRISDKHSK